MLGIKGTKAKNESHCQHEGEIDQEKVDKNETLESSDPCPSTSQSECKNEGSSRSKSESSSFGRCKVCRDKATGMHYGVITCEGCKV